MGRLLNMWDTCSPRPHVFVRVFTILSPPVIAAAAAVFRCYKKKKKRPGMLHQYELLVNFHPKNKVIKKREREQR